jgi:hypothetical protein
MTKRLDKKYHLPRGKVNAHHTKLNGNRPRKIEAIAKNSQTNAKPHITIASIVPTT